jgi:hypothetical protein
MRRFFLFYWQCTKIAARENSAFANDWQWLIGYPATAAVLWLLGYFYAELSGRIEVTLSTGALGALAAAFVAYIITWLVSFIGRFLNAPVRLYYEQKDRADKLEGLPALAIIFDAKNTNNRFWSIETARDKEGKQISGESYWEYRTIVKNISHKTIKNVKVIVEAIGPSPTRPEQSVFDIDRKPIRDMAPEEEAFVIIRT